VSEVSLSELAAVGDGVRGYGGRVLLGMPDVNGVLRGKALGPAAFEAALRDGSVLTNLLLALDPTDEPITDYESFGIRAGAADLLLRPDPSTLRELTWLPGWHVCLATPVWPDGSPCELASRELLRRALRSMADLGYETRAAFEYEARLSDAQGTPLWSGLSYGFDEISSFREFVARLGPALDALEVELAAIHTEAGPGLLELNIAAREGIRAADDATYARLAVKGAASAMGLNASFLAKTRQGEEGSSGHIHFSFWREGSNAFASELESGQLPAVFVSSIAGVLDHLPGASLMLGPTINSYKRLVPGWFAPVNSSWGLENRTAALRAIPAAQPERCRIECRRPGADANPYLALAALVAAAEDGIRREARPPPAIEGDACARADLRPLPGSLESALVAFEADSGLRAALGEVFCSYYATSRRWELKAWRDSVADWERERYGRVV
jgi:glutamine synthetase